jgi:DNA-binding response OmpR family regulator
VHHWLPPAERSIGVPAKDILIVDDEAGICELLAGALEDVGYAVDVAATADEARSLLHEHRYGMVVVDWRLPDGDGAVIASHAEAAGSHAFVMSGYLPRMLAGNIDPRQTLMKPVKPSELLAAARECIGEPSHAKDHP